MSNKFGQFLADDQPREQSRRQTRPPLVAGGDDVSIKVKASTLSQLKLLKTIEDHRSYAELIAHLLEDYLDHAGSDLQDKIDILKER